MVDLRWTDFTFFQPFFRREARKLRAIVMFYLNSSLVILTSPIVTAISVCFFS
jgi:hypothetical protein